MAIMAVELEASRLLAPFFSSSQIVWTIIIATIMIAMALGNIYGGKSADRRPEPAVLYRRLLIAHEGHRRDHTGRARLLQKIYERSGIRGIMDSLDI